MTNDFLDWCFDEGTDLYAERLEDDFPGLLAGDKYCIGIEKWLRAALSGKAPPIKLESCHESVLQYVSLDQLKALVAGSPVEDAKLQDPAK